MPWQEIRLIGTGSDAVNKFCNIVKEKGIPEAKEIQCLWENNYLVTISGEGLIAFFKRHYPDLVDGGHRIDPAEEYVIDCYDMS